MTGKAETGLAYEHVTADSQRLRVQRIAGPGGRPTLVFLHEGLGSIPQWRDFPSKACTATGLPGLVYERLGHGGSAPVSLPRPDDFLWREAEHVLPALLAACGVGPHVLLGHSDGGTVALIYASLYPERPQAVITMAAHVELEPMTEAALAGVVERWDSDPDFRARLARHHGANTEAMFHGWVDVWTRASERGWSIVECLSRITCPVLAIHGELDEHGSWNQVKTILARVSGPAEGLCVPASGHSPHLDSGPFVLERIIAYLGAKELRG